MMWLLILLRLDQSFIETLSRLNKNFSGADKQRLTTSIDSKYDDIRSIVKEQENNNTNFEPKVIELGKIGSRNFTLYPYKRKDRENDDIL